MAERRAPGRTAHRGASAPAYPAHWEADIALADGSAAHLRPILPRDADALRSFHEAQSEQSRYLRFFAPMPRLSAKDVERFTHVDHRDRVAFVVLVGEDIIAVGRYDRVGEHEAEVAFNVSDARQGTGVGSVLLEHLAAAAREHDITTFEAEVLPQNTRMLRVFTDAGFDVSRTYDDGVVLVSFRIDPTERSLAVMAEREQRTASRAIARLLHPRSVLLVGVSSRADSIGGRVLSSLEASGYDGAIHLVAREALELRGHRTHASISEVPGPVDIAVLALRPEAWPAAIDECAAIGVRTLVIPTEGFTDSEHGRARQRALVARVRRHGMRLLGPGAFGVLRAGEDPLSVSLAPSMPRPGAIALAGQSSALSAMLLAGVDRRGMALHEFIAVGNRADVSLNDILQHWEDDEQARVIALALESMGNPRKFTRIARRLTRGRPVVVLRPPGLDVSGTPGHDVRASSLPRRALDQVLASSGVIRTSTVDHLLDVTDAIARQGVPQGRRVALLSNTAALGGALRGAADEAGMQVSIDRRDVPLAADPRVMQRAFTSIAGPGHADLVIAGVVDPLTSDAAGVLRQMAQIARHSEVALLVCLITTHERMTEVLEQVRADDALPPVHATAVSAVRAAEGMLRATAHEAQDEEPPAGCPVGVDLAAARAVVEAHVPSEEGASAVLDEEAAAQLLGACGIELPRAQQVRTVEDAVGAASAMGYPVVLKSSDPELRHRSDLGAVRMDLEDDEHLRHAFAQMHRELSYSSAPFEVQPMIPAGVPMVVRSVEDPSLGPVVSLSVAGDATELLEDIAYAIPPLSEQAARRLVDAPAAAVKLRGHRGLPPADREALARLVITVSQLAEAVPELASLELHPVLVAQEGARVVSARIELSPAPNRTDGERRVLSPAGGGPA